MAFLGPVLPPPTAIPSVAQAAGASTTANQTLLNMAKILAPALLGQMSGGGGDKKQPQLVPPPVTPLQVIPSPGLAQLAQILLAIGRQPRPVRPAVSLIPGALLGGER